jgi:prepilin-type N-terminal cleavage/methylation domain-containing protein
MRIRRPGFTIMELLVTLSIILVLAAILLPAINKARKQASRVQCANNLRTISLALQIYKDDTKGYIRVAGPPVSLRRGYDGAVELARWLLPLPGSKYRNPQLQAPYGTTVQGKRYLNPDDFPTRVISPETGDYVLLDLFDQPILYFPASPARSNVRIPSTSNPPYIGVEDVYCRYDSRDNTGPTIPTDGGSFSRAAGVAQQNALTPLQRFQIMLGDRQGNGTLDMDEREIDKPFLLWSTGPDGVFGPETAESRCDDVTNFED